MNGRSLSDGVGRFTIDLVWVGDVPSGLDWFPATDPAIAIENTHIESRCRGYRIAFDVRVFAGGEPPDPLMSSLVVETDLFHRGRGYVVSVPLGDVIPSVE